MTEFKEGDIDAALARLKKSEGLCDRFDAAVKRADNLTRLERLQFVAIDMDRGDLYNLLVKELDKPKYIVPTTPVKGEYVRLTMANGETREGEVRATGFVNNLNQYPGGYTSVNLQGDSSWREYHIFHSQEGADHYDWAPDRKVVAVEKIVKPVELPEVGRWIEATDAEGTTKVIEVTINGTSLGVTRISHWWVSPNNARIDDADLVDPSTDRGRIVSWKYVDKPWAVGDVIPAGTKVGREWLGSYPGVPNKHFSAEGKSTANRTIIWIEEA